MSITIKFFASIRQRCSRSELEIEHLPGMTVRDVWDSGTDGIELPADTLFAINLVYAKVLDEVSDGDEVAFFPPVTGG